MICLLRFEAVHALSAILCKLAAYERQTRLDFALAELGRIERRLFTLFGLRPLLPQLVGINWDMV